MKALLKEQLDERKNSLLTGARGVTLTILFTVVLCGKKKNEKSCPCQDQTLSPIPQTAISLTHVIYTYESFDSVSSFRYTLHTSILLVE
jgi:hypothetical protein